MLFNTIFKKYISINSKNLLNIKYPLISRSISSSNLVDLAYSVYDNCGKTSTKPPVLVFHGILGSNKDVDHISKEINRTTGRKVIAVDHRNHGDSPHSPHNTYFHIVADVMKLLKRLDYTKISVLGHCMGGIVAMVLALTHPDSVFSVAIEDVAPGKTSDRGLPLENVLEVCSTLRISSDVPMITARQLADKHLETEIKYTTFRHYIIDELVNSNTGFYKFKFNIPVLKEAYMAGIFDFPRNLKGFQYTGPTLFIAGARSDFIRKSDLPHLKEYFPSSEITYIEEVGHAVHRLQPEKFLEILCKFLREK